MKKIAISAIIPLYNEEQSLKILYDRLTKNLRLIDKQYEIIFIDDGSTDTSLSILKQLESKDSSIRIYSFRRNQGKSEALSLGFQVAEGNTMVTLDADLQDRPGEIKKLIEKSKHGYDLVSGWRKDRKDNFRIRFGSKVFNVIVGMVWGTKLHDYNCGLKVYSKELAKSLRLYGGMHRFIPLLAHEQGFRITELEVSHDKRQFGKSKYGFSKIGKDLPDMFTMMFLTRYAKRPLHFFWTIGSLLVCMGMMILMYLWIVQLQGHSIGRRPLLFVGFFVLISGLQIFFTGFLADLIINTTYVPKDGNTHMYRYLKYATEKIAR